MSSLAGIEQLVQLRYLSIRLEGLQPGVLPVLAQLPALSELSVVVKESPGVESKLKIVSDLVACGKLRLLELYIYSRPSDNVLASRAVELVCEALADSRCRIYMLRIFAQDGPAPVGAEELLLAASLCPSLRNIVFEHLTSTAGGRLDATDMLLRLVGGKTTLKSTDGRHVLLEELH